MPACTHTHNCMHIHNREKKHAQILQKSILSSSVAMSWWQDNQCNLMLCSQQLFKPTELYYSQSSKNTKYVRLNFDKICFKLIVKGYLVLSIVCNTYIHTVTYVHCEILAGIQKLLRAADAHCLLSLSPSQHTHSLI